MITQRVFFCNFFIYKYIKNNDKLSEPTQSLHDNKLYSILIILLGPEQKPKVLCIEERIAITCIIDITSSIATHLHCSVPELQNEMQSLPAHLQSYVGAVCKQT